MKLGLGIFLAIAGVLLYLFHRDVALLVFGNAFAGDPDIRPMATLPDENMVAGFSYIVLGLGAVLTIIHFVSKGQAAQGDRQVAAGQSGKGTAEPLASAVWDGNISLARKLLEEGHDVNHTGATGESLLQLAERRGDKPMIALLRDFGAGETKPRVHEGAAVQPAQETTVIQASRACPECGETVLAVARKCKHCGSAIEPIAETPQAGPVAPRAMDEAPGRPATEDMTKTEGSGARKIVIGIVAAVVALGGLLWFASRHEEGSSGDAETASSQEPPQPAAAVASETPVVEEPVAPEQVAVDEAPADPDFGAYEVAIYDGDLYPADWMMVSESGEWSDQLGKPMDEPEINFAGKYYIGLHSCGTGCRYYSMTDLSTGHSLNELVARFAAGEERSTMADGREYLTQLVGQADSTLLIAQYHIETVLEPTDECREQAFVLEAEVLRAITDVRNGCTEL